MKIKLVTVYLGILFSISTLTAQQTEHPTFFKYSKAQEPSNKLIGWASTLNNYIIVQSPGTVEENYGKVLDFIKVTFSNPDQVIDVVSENKFIRIKGVAPDLYYTSSLPLMSEKDDVRYTITIYVKADRMKVEINSMEYKHTSIEYQAPPRYDNVPIDKIPDHVIKEVEVVKWKPLNEIYIYKYSGKPKKRVFGKTDTFIENYFNGLVNMFLTYSKSMSKNSDW